MRGRIRGQVGDQIGGLADAAEENAVAVGRGFALADETWGASSIGMSCEGSSATVAERAADGLRAASQDSIMTIAVRNIFFIICALAVAFIL